MSMVSSIGLNVEECTVCVVQARRLQEKGWKPRWFEKDEEGNYRYLGGYWEAREKKDWDGITDIFKKQQQRKTLSSSSSSTML